jgi:serine/threonine protein phosphatase 1
LNGGDAIQRIDLDGPVAVIGDIHGGDDLLAELLPQLGDLPVLVTGDVCDRGPDTRSVIEMLLARDAGGVRGNHEDWVLAWQDGHGFDSIALHPMFGGAATLASYDVAGRDRREIEEQRWRMPAPHRAWLSDLPLAVDLWVEGEAFWLVHAGVPASWRAPRLDPREIVPWMVRHTPHDLTWVHTPPEAVMRTDRTVVMGHYPIDEPVDLGHVIGLDTGAGIWGPRGRLTAVVLPERRFVTVAR